MLRFDDSGQTTGHLHEGGPTTSAIGTHRPMSQALVDLWGPVMPSGPPARVASIGLAAEMKIIPALPADP